MDCKKRKMKFSPNCRANASILSAMTFFWTLPLLRKGYRKELDTSDLAPPLKEHTSHLLGDVFEKEWNTQLRLHSEGKIAKPSLLRVIIHVFGRKALCFALGYCSLEMVLRLSQPLLLGRLLNYFSPKSEVTASQALMYASGVVICIGLNQIAFHPYILAIAHTGMKIRVSMCSLVYRKCLRLSTAASSKVSAGHVINLLTSDASRFDYILLFLPDALTGLTITGVALYLMWSRSGLPAVVGIGILSFFLPIQAILAKKTSNLRQQAAVRTDERIRLMNEVISGIQVIKMYAWEKPFEKLVSVLRRKEIGVIRRKSYVVGFLMSFTSFLTKFALFASVVIYAWLDKPITAENVFVMTLYFNLLQESLTLYFPMAITKMAECAVSIKRIQAFLLREEVSEAIHRYEVPCKADIFLRKACAKWRLDVFENTLDDLTMHISSGCLTAIVGPVGSGKTSLLCLLLKELPLTAGSLDINGRVSYASQEAWLFNGTVRQNILFGLPMDRKRYRDVVRSCALGSDFQQLPYGDKTMVGDRGLSLSGGQRARVNLARAVYRQADIYLLDDPLSAVDTHVGRHLFEECFCGYLSGKTVILVTHQLQYLSAVRHIIVMEAGKVTHEGSFAELKAVGHKLLQVEHNKMENQDEDDSDVSRKQSIRSVLSEDGELPLSDEMRSSGNVKLQVYCSYITAAMKWPFLIVLLFLFVMSQLSVSMSDYWLSFWVDFEEQSKMNDTRSGMDYGGQSENDTLSGVEFAEQPTDTLAWVDYDEQVTNKSTLPVLGAMSREKCIYVYTFLTITLISFVLFRTFAFYFACMQASKRLHDRMFNSISRATMHFFNTNPSGRILNRFSQDISIIDEVLPETLLECVKAALLTGGVFVIVTVVNWWLTIPLACMIVLFIATRQYYVKTSRSLKRLEGMTRSPIYTHVNASLQGLVTIRAMKAETELRREFDFKQDVNSVAWYYNRGVNRAFGYFLDLVCWFYVTMVTFSFLLVDVDFMGGQVGLAITQSMGLVFVCQWGMRQSAEVENQMTAVERVREFSKVVGEKHLLETPLPLLLPKNWPNKGEVEFRNVSLRYSPMEPAVLKNLTFKINPGEKVGVVGRTGAGKSSLVSALFRLQPVEGNVLIDGIDTSLVGLELLRSSISIIPQEAVLFSGTMRYNLDPFEQFPDCELWMVLEEVELREVVQDLVGGLSANVSEGGCNLSMGQRQLVCLARAILRNSRVLVLDEATASVDRHTDALIQSTIRRRFAHCTVLTVAHRLYSIMDSDRILVMERGCAMEFDPPHILLQKPDGIFNALVHQAGNEGSAQIRAFAERHYNEKFAITSGDSS